MDVINVEWYKIEQILCFFCSRYFSVADVVSTLEDNDFQNADIFILPPEDANKSDEDSRPEDDDGDIGSLCGNQLRAEATVTVSGFDKKRIGADMTDHEEHSDTEASSDTVDSSSTTKRHRTSYSTMTVPSQPPVVSRT